MAYVASNLRDAAHYSIVESGLNQIVAETGVPATILSSQVDTDYDPLHPYQPIVVNTLDHYRCTVLDGLIGDNTHRRNAPFLEIAQEVFDNMVVHLPDLLSSPWAKKDKLREVIVTHVGFNNVQAQTWTASDGSSRPGLYWRKDALSSSLRAAFGKLAVLGSGMLSASVRKQSPACPKLFYGETVETNSLYHEFLDMLRDWFGLTGLLRAQMLAAAFTFTINSTVTPCLGENCKVAGCPGKDGDLLAWLWSNEFASIVHPHVVEQLRKEARTCVQTHVTWEQTGSYSFKDISIHRDKENGSRPSDSNLTAIQHIRPYAEFSFLTRIFIVGHGHSGPSLSFGALTYGRDYLTTYVLQQEGVELKFVAKYIQDRYDDVIIDVEGKSSNFLKYIEFVSSDEQLLPFVASNIVHEPAKYGTKTDFQGPFVKIPAMANQFGYLNPFAHVGAALIWEFQLDAGKVAELCFVFGCESNGVKRVCDISLCLLSHVNKKGWAYDVSSMFDAVGELRLDPNADVYDDEVSMLGYDLLRTGQCKEGSIESLLKRPDVSLRKLFCCLLRSHPYCIVKRRWQKENRAKQLKKGDPKTWKGKTFYGSTTTNRYQSSHVLSSMSDNILFVENDADDRFSSDQFRYFELIFVNTKFQRPAARRVRHKDVGDLYHDFVAELSRLTCLKNKGVGFYKTLQLLAFFGLVDPRFFDQGEVVKDTGPWELIDKCYGDTWKERNDVTPLADRMKNAFDETHNLLFSINKHQTRGLTEHQMCEIMKGCKKVRNSSLTQRDVHPDVLLLQPCSNQKALVQHTFRRRGNKAVGTDNWKTTVFDIFINGEWRRFDDMFIPPWHCADFGSHSKYRRPWLQDHSGAMVEGNCATWLRAKDSATLPFPTSQRYVNFTFTE